MSKSTIKTIWKYELEKVGGDQSLSMPPLSDVVRVGMQGCRVCLWALVVPVDAKSFRARTFRITGTGQPVSEEAAYVGGCSDGQFEWHVWETTL